MSTVTVARKNDEICIASESLITFGNTKMPEDYVADSAKIIPWGDSYLGMVGSVALSMVFRDIIRKEENPPDFTSAEEVYHYFTKLHKKLKKKYFLNPQENEDDPVESSQLEIVLVNPYGIFGVNFLREVYDLQKFWAYGSGTDYALGAMHALYERPEFDARQIAEAGVRAGVAFDDASGGTVVSYVLPLKKTS